MNTPPQNPSEGQPPQDPHDDGGSADAEVPVQPARPDGPESPLGGAITPASHEGGHVHDGGAPYVDSGFQGSPFVSAPGASQSSGQNPYGPGPYGVPPHYDPALREPASYGQSPGMPPYGAHGYAPGHPDYGPVGPTLPHGMDPRGRPLSDPQDKYSKGIWGQPDSRPGRFRWWDLLPAVPYLGVMMVMPLVITFLMGPSVEQTEGVVDADGVDWLVEFVFNALLFVTFFGLALGVSGKALWRSARTFTHHALAWLKLVLVPVLWVAVLVVNAVLMAILMLIFGSEPEVSANQTGVEEMVGAVPFWAALLVFGVLGPYVEEYFFRHLLVGKLSRHLNIWVCAVLSILPFAFVHVAEELASGDLQLVLATVLPYLTMSVVFTLAYILSGRSLMFAWLLHAFNNSMALILQTFVMPHLPDDMEPAPALHAVTDLLLPLLGIFAPESAVTLR